MTNYTNFLTSIFFILSFEAAKWIAIYPSSSSSSFKLNSASSLFDKNTARLKAIGNFSLFDEVKDYLILY